MNFIQFQSRTSVLLLTIAALVAPSMSSGAKRVKAHKLDLSTCPYNGLPPIESFVGDNITIAGIKFNLSRVAHAAKFQQLLAVCNCATATGPYTQWRQARSLVVAKSAEAGAYAMSATARAISAESDAERQAIAKDAAEKAAQLAAELAPLSTDSLAKKKVFQATFMACMAP